MKRLSNDDERKLLQQNQKMFIKGTKATSPYNRYRGIYAGIGVATVVSLLAFMPLADMFAGNKLGFWACILLLCVLSVTLTYRHMNKNDVNGDKKSCLKAGQLFINGATIVGGDSAKGAILYIEDNVNDGDGKPIVFEYPALISEIRPEDIGKRLIVMYAGEGKVQLARANNALAGLIPSYSIDYPLSCNIEDCTMMPHPNALNLEYCKRGLSEIEKKELGKVYTRFIVKGSIVLGLGILAMILIILKIPRVNGITIFVWIAFIIGFISLLGKNLGRRAAQFVSIQEVLFHSNEVINHRKYVSKKLNVYEWINGRCIKTTYNNMSAPKGTKYGEVLYKLINTKGNVVFVRKSDKKMIK